MKTPQKTCKRCREVLTTDHFHRSAQSRDGYYYICILCRHRTKMGEFSDGLPRTPGDPVERFWSKVDKTGECWIWTATLGAGGFGSFGYYTADGVAENTLAHRYSYEISHGSPPPPRVRVYQECENKLCVRPDHLFIQYDERWLKLRAKIAKRRREQEE